jgi:uncharacterized protein YidB (DUF937 family)
MSGFIGLLGGLTSLLENNPQQTGAAANLLSGLLASSGGVSGIVQKFQQAGLGGTVSSWVGNGENLSVTAEEVLKVFPPAQIEALAAQHGLPAGTVTTLLTHLLPHAVDAATPGGEVPPAGSTPNIDFAGLIGRVLGGQAGQRQAPPQA